MRAFYGCTSLTSVTIGNSVASIGTYAFWHCTSLKSIIIPDSVTSIGEKAFYACMDITIYCKANIFGVWYDDDAIVIRGRGSIYEMVPDIEDRTPLFYHDTLTIDTNGNLTYTFKSDNNPFKNEGTTYGLSYTKFGKVFVNGYECEIAEESYITQDWYRIQFKILDWSSYWHYGKNQILFTIESNDPSGVYCANSNGYYALNTFEINYYYNK